jgi:ring-1,2-phenylacetyl-CoA epoxidase subunit PaaE
MSEFHELKVTHVRKTIRDAVVVTVEPTRGGNFEFIPGQYLTVRHELEGTELRRCYSICAARGEDLQIGIKKVSGGAFSTWANETLKPGMMLEAMEPMGNFYSTIDPGSAKTYLGFAGGSGITPILSILKTILSEEGRASFTLVYANRGVNTIMFREDLEDLKNLYMGRLQIIHVLESDAQEVDLFKGRVDAEKCAALFEHLVDVASVDTAFICGPEPMMQIIAAALREHGMTNEQIKFELFASSQQGRLPRTTKIKPPANATAEKTMVTLTLDGAARSFEMSPGAPILNAALENDIDVPYACRAGVCSTCKCRVIAGEVEMITNHALEDYEVERGFVLSCQSYPLTARLVLNYDDH